MRPAGSPKILQRHRERAMQMLKDGYQPYEVAAKLKVDRRSVRRWRAAYRQQGAQALQAKPAPGRPSKLSDREKGQLEQRHCQKNYGSEYAPTTQTKLCMGQRKSA